jgi:hypothetical protein
LNSKKEIFSDVYKTLLDRHYSKDSIDKAKMVSEATKALAEAT